MQLYEDEGLCAFSYGTGGQPPIASYYLAREAQRLHPDSLKTIVLDASLLRSVLPTQRYQQVFDTMPLNATKVEAVSTYANLEDDEATGVKAGFHRLNNTISYLFPLLEYHARWAEIQKLDYVKGDFPDQDYLRGFVLYTSRYVDNDRYDPQSTPEYALDTKVTPTVFPGEPVEYFNKLADFCEEKDIRLVLMKTPASNWTSADSLAARQLAQERGVEFLDFNFGDLLDELDYNRALDSVDGVHLNKWGAAKLTRSIGRYLVEKCGATDVRGDSRYAYMDELLAEYKEIALDPVRLVEADDVCDYLDMAMDPNADYSILVTVQGDGVTSLTAAQRHRLRKLGLGVLADRFRCRRASCASPRR